MSASIDLSGLRALVTGVTSGLGAGIAADACAGRRRCGRLRARARRPRRRDSLQSRRCWPRPTRVLLRLRRLGMATPPARSWPGRPRRWAGLTWSSPTPGGASSPARPPPTKPPGRPTSISTSPRTGASPRRHGPGSSARPDRDRGHRLRTTPSTRCPVASRTTSPRPACLLWCNRWPSSGLRVRCGRRPGLHRCADGRRLVRTFLDPAAKRAQVEAIHPSGRLGTPADIGALVAFRECRGLHHRHHNHHRRRAQRPCRTCDPLGGLSRSRS